MNLYQPAFLTKLLNLSILLIAFALNMGIAMSVQADVYDTAAEARKIELNTEYNDQLLDFFWKVGTDTNYYKFELPSDGSIITRLWFKDASVDLLSAWQVELFQAGDLKSKLYKTVSINGDGSNIQSGLIKGVYYLKVYCPIIALITCDTTPYYLQIDFIDNPDIDKEPNDDPMTATDIETNKEYTGNLQTYEDIDYYKFHLPHESDVTFTLRHEDDSLMSGEVFWHGELFDTKSYVSHKISLLGTPNNTSIKKRLLAGHYYIEVNTPMSPPYTNPSRTKPFAPYYLEVKTDKVKYAGYAIIVQGRDEDGTLKEEYNRTVENVYRKLIRRGFLNNEYKEHIKYFEQDKVNPHDDIPDEYVKPQIKEAIVKWAKDEMNNAPAPLYIIMVDHAQHKEFQLEPESISANEINSWLDTLEAGLKDEYVKSQPIFFILGSCNSGSFIDDVSKPGRIIITSASANEKSYTSLKLPIPNSTADGELFIKVLFEQLADSKTFMNAFKTATDEVKDRTRNKKQQQHPLFNDDDDSSGSTTLMYDGDGQKISRLKLGFDDQIANKQAVRRFDLDMDINYIPIDIVEKTETLYLDNNDSSATLWLKTDYNGSEQVYSGIFIETPNPADVTEKQHGDGQIELSLPAKELIFNYDNSRFEAEYDDFKEPGKYTIFYIASDPFGNTSRTYKSTVYKNKASNNPPESFSLLLPKYGATTQTTLLLDWEPSIDPDDDSVIYNLVISSGVDSDKKLQNIVYQEELQHSSVIIDNSILKTLETYYWRVEAVDDFGARTSSEIFSFNTEDTSEEIGGYTGNVVGILGELIDKITITITPIDKPEFAISKDYYRENEEVLEFEHIFDDEEPIFEVFLINLGSSTKYNLKINTLGFQERIIENLDINEIIIFGQIELQPLTTFKDNLLDIPVVFVEGLGRYSAKLRWKSDQNIFGLESLEFLEGVNNEITNEVTYDDATKIVYITLVEIGDMTTRSQVKLELFDPVAWKFRLTDSNSLF